MIETFDQNRLINALKSEYEIVATWGAYQVLRLPNEDIKDFIPLFLQSPFSTIQDAGLARIAEMGLQDYITEILKIFRKTEGQTKYSAAFALSHFPNDFSKVLIQKWFENLITSDQSTRMEFESATYAFLQINRDNNFPHVLKALENSQKDAVKSSVLFSYLLMFCESSFEYEQIADQYFILRDLHSDADISFQLIEQFGCLELKDWMTDNIAKGYSISSIFEQCSTLLGYDDDLTYRRFWNDIEQAYGSFDIIRPGAPKDFPKFINSIEKWITYLKQISKDNSDSTGLAAVVKGFQKNLDMIENTIPKIVEMECHFLLTIPIQIMLDIAVAGWLKQPTEYLDDIARYYNSSLLIKDYREEILWMFFPKSPDWTQDQVAIRKTYSPVSISDSRNEVLWSFFREELLGYDIPWPNIFPNPEYSFNLSKGLFLIYFNNFDYYIHIKNRIAVDYALQLFRLHPEKSNIPQIIKHFEYLSDNHTESLYQTIEYLPDPKFLDRLVSKYEKEEFELTRLIFIICEIFELPIPTIVENDLNKLKSSSFRGTGIKKPVRLNCDKCKSTFQYPVDIVYIDEGAILRMNKLSPESVWVPQKFHCKKCGFVVPFQLDDSQLNEFSLQSRVDRLLKLTPQTIRSQFDHTIILIDFPRHESITFSPEAFEKLVAQYEKTPDINEEELKGLWMKQAKMYKAMRNWKSCLFTLSKIEPVPKHMEIDWYFLGGLANYKLTNFAVSRIRFDYLAKNFNHISEESIGSSLIDQSKYFLKILDSSDAKRSRFKVITGKQ